jgi:SnoaL-like polyketide cyclase
LPTKLEPRILPRIASATRGLAVETMQGEEEMSIITAIAKQFFEACEAGKGWEVCRAYCTTNASFSAQAEPLAELRTLQEYANWMKGLLKFMPDGRYVVKSFATDDERNNVSAYGVFSATHTGDGGPCPPTDKSTTTDYVYVMDFDGDKIRHMTKIWNAGWAMKELGWG